MNTLQYFNWHSLNKFIVTVFVCVCGGGVHVGYFQKAYTEGNNKSDNILIHIKLLLDQSNFLYHARNEQKFTFHNMIY